MKIAVAKETREGEARVAMVPELVGKLTGLGYDVAVEPDAGRHALIADEEYAEAGARARRRTRSRRPTWWSRCSRWRPTSIRRLRRGAATISFLPTNQEPEVVTALRDAGVTSFAMELVPRISRAQSMDALSSQALVSGYRCAIVAAGMLRRFFPLNMTAAGTVQPAEVVVLGAGVAGLQAIATAKRLGAVVKAYDVRAAAAEEIRSMGAQSIDLELDTLEGAGGYAREMTEDRARLQMERLAPYVADADALITTAAVPGRRAPLLVTAAMVEQMKPGSVVVDLAAETGGNVEGSVPGEVVRIGNAQVWGGRNVPSQMPGPASQLYAQNIVNVVTLMTAGRGRRWRLRARLRGRDRRRLLRHARRRDPPRAHPRALEGPRKGSQCMNEAVVWLTIFILSVFVGIEVISKVSSTLHTPLMSGANAIHGIILLGAIIVTGRTENAVALVVGLVAIVLAAVNMVGGFVVTDRMLQMFVRKKPRRRRPSTLPGGTRDPDLGAAGSTWRRGLLHPRAQGPLRPQDRPRGNLIGAAAAVVAFALPFFYPDLDHVPLIVAAIAVGTAGGVVGARTRADDPDAADGGALQRRRRRCGGAGRAARAARDRRASTRHRVHPRRHRVHDHDRLGVVRRLDRHLRQAPGADDLAAGDLPGPAGRLRPSRSPRSWCSRSLIVIAGGVARHRPRAARPGLRRAARAAGRRRRRTDRHLAAQRVHRPHRGGERLRAGQRPAAGRGHAGRRRPARS